MAMKDVFKRFFATDEPDGRHAVSANRPQRLTWAFLGGGTFNKRYSDAYVWLVANKIFKGLSNVRFYHPDERVEFSDLCAFIENNLSFLWWQHVNVGYMVVCRRDGQYYIPNAEDIRLDVDRTIIEPPGEEWCVHYSRPYALMGVSDMNILRENVNNIDTYKNADDYLCRTYGALGILSGKDVPLNLNDRNDVLDAIKETKGITGDKQQFIISNNPISFEQLTLPVEQLRLTDKINEELKVIADYFGVPYDMLATSGQSTYANQAQANKNFYGNCIAPFAEDVLTILRAFVRRSSLLVNSQEWTFSIDNVDGLHDERDKALDRLTKIANVRSSLPILTEEQSAAMDEVINELISEL